MPSSWLALLPIMVCLGCHGHEAAGGDGSADTPGVETPGTVTLAFQESPGLEVHVDGTLVEAETLPFQRLWTTRVFDTQEEMESHVFELQLWVQGGPLLKAAEVGVRCAGGPESMGPVESEHMSFCQTPALRSSSSTCSNYGGSGAAYDGSCRVCDVIREPTDLAVCSGSCKIAILSAAPLYFEHNCTELGTQPIGESCTRRDDGNDDCVEGSVCIGGTCEKLCPAGDCTEDCPGIPSYLPTCDVDSPLEN